MVPQRQDAATSPGPSPARPWWRRPLVWAGFVLSGLTVVVFTQFFDLGRVAATLTRADPLLMLAAAAVFMITYGLRGWRWKLLLSPMGDYPYRTVRDVLLVGFMGNWILPARGGELARTLILWRLTGASWRGALATVAVERLFDALTIIGILSALSQLFDVPPLARKIGWLTTAAMAGTLAGALWTAYHPASLFGLMERALFFVPARLRTRVVAFCRTFVQGFAALRRPRLLLPVAGLSVVVWILEVVVYLLVMRAFDIGLPFWAAGVTLVVTNFSIAAPSAPGALGVFEAGCSGTLIALGVNKDLALSYAIGVHLLFFVCIVGFGLLVLWRLGLGLGDLTRTGGSAPPDAECPHGGPARQSDPGDPQN